jgi:transposase
MSGDMTTRRFDVVASTRRNWSREQKLAIVAEVDVAGASLSQVARRHGVHASLLFRWRRKLKEKPEAKLKEKPEAPAGEVENGASPATPEAVPAQRFMPVRLQPPEAPAPAKPSVIEIVVEGGRVVRVGADVDTAALVRIVKALETGR